MLVPLCCKRLFSATMVCRVDRDLILIRMISWTEPGVGRRCWGRPKRVTAHPEPVSLMECVVHADNLTQPAIARLKVERVVDEADLLAFARALVDACT